MSLINKIKNTFSNKGGENKEFAETVEKLKKETLQDSIHTWKVKFNKIPFYKEVVDKWPDEKKIAFIIYCVKKSHEFNNSGRSNSNPFFKNSLTQEAFLMYIFKTNINLTSEDVFKIVETFSKYQRYSWTDLSSWPTLDLIKRLEKQLKDKELDEDWINVFKHIEQKIKSISNYKLDKSYLKILDTIEEIIARHKYKGGVKPVLFKGIDPFTDFANPIIEALPDDEKHIWYSLIGHAQKAKGGKPTNKYMKEAKGLLENISAEKYLEIINQWFEFVTALKHVTEEHTTNSGNHTWTTSFFMATPNTDALKGFVWMCSHYYDTPTIRNMVKMAERCYKKIPGQGPAAAGLGNSCLYTLSKTEGMEGIGQLSKLKLRVKQSNTQKMIQNYLNQAAKEQGVSIYEIEDMAVDGFGLTNGKKEIIFDDYKAELRITGVGKSTLAWYKPDGKTQKSIPAFVKKNYASELKQIKSDKKQIEQTITAQRDRIDRMFRINREWEMDNFMPYYFQHGLMSFLSQKIIWTFSKNNKNDSLIYLNGNWTNSKNEIIEPEKDSIISLWHPATKTTEEITQWREFLITHEIQQPLKQAFRELYILTDAEINTRTYSNRMAAHVLKQHQFNNLAKMRGWKYSLLGGFDDGRDYDMAEIFLPEYNIRAEFWVNGVNADDAFNESGMCLYITTDQVRFVDTRNTEIVELADIPPALFSEIMRDVDLFVGVASIGNDPEWRDSGGVPRYQDYWTSYAFGDLNEMAKNRKGILTNLIPRLKIRSVAAIRGKFLVVQGKLRTYKIHIGSTNILMEPNDQYLCIVPDRSKKDLTQNLFIPFEGDKGLSVILSKAFLLAADDRITDATITRQILRK